MTTKAIATFRRNLRAAGISLPEERNMAITFAMQPGFTHCTIYDKLRELEDDEGTHLVASMYGPEAFCHEQVFKHGGTVYTLEEVAKALDVDGVIEQVRSDRLRV